MKLINFGGFYLNPAAIAYIDESETQGDNVTVNFVNGNSYEFNKAIIDILAETPLKDGDCAIEEYCIYCGTRIPKHKNKCTSCGAPVKE